MIKAYALALPFVESDMRLSTALSNRALTNFGAVIRPYGPGDFRMHSVDELRTTLRRAGTATKFVNLGDSGHKFLALPEKRIMSAGWTLVLPKGGEADKLYDTYDERFGFKPRMIGNLVLKTAFLFTGLGRHNYALVGNGYRCSRFYELYGQRTYDDYRGKCPKHAGAVLRPVISES